MYSAKNELASFSSFSVKEDAKYVPIIFTSFSLPSKAVVKLSQILNTFLRFEELETVEGKLKLSEDEDNCSKLLMAANIR